MIPSVRAIVAGTRAGSAIGSSGTKKTPSGKRSRDGRRERDAEAGLARRRRARSGSAGGSRRGGACSFASSARARRGSSAGAAGCRSGASTRPQRRELRHAGRRSRGRRAAPGRRSLSLCSPRSRSGHAGQGRAPTRARVTDDRTTCAAVRRRGDPRRAVDVRADVAPVAIQDARPRVDAHPDPDLLAGRPRLGLRARAARPRPPRPPRAAEANTTKNESPSVAISTPSARAERRPDDRAVAREDGLVALGARARSRRRGGPLDVREQERDRAGRARGGADGRAAAHRTVSFAVERRAAGPNSSWARATAAG